MNLDKRTKLIFGMPGSGKTSTVKFLNGKRTIENRLVIDYDYRAPRVFAEEVMKCQSALMNAWARWGIKAIFTFPQFMDLTVLDQSLFKIIFVLPTNASMLVKRVIDRAMKSEHLDKIDKGNNAFIHDYIKHASQYLKDWSKLAVKFKELGFDVEVRFMRPDQYLSDVVRLDDFCDTPGEVWNLSEELGCLNTRIVLPRRRAESSEIASELEDEVYKAEHNEVAQECLSIIRQAFDDASVMPLVNTQAIVDRCLPDTFWCDRIPSVLKHQLKSVGLIPVDLEGEVDFFGNAETSRGLKDLKTGFTVKVY